MSAITCIGIRAVVFDLYGTLIEAPHGGVRHDPDADPLLREILTRGRWREGIRPAIPASVLESPSHALWQAVLDHHAKSITEFPEVDLRSLWAGLLGLSPTYDAGPLVAELHSAWNPASWIHGAREAIFRAHGAGLVLGILSNAQWDTWEFLGGMRACFEPDLMLFSFEHGIAKPSPELFRTLKSRLATRGIAAGEVCYIGNDPAHDILPAMSAGFTPVLFRRPLPDGHGHDSPPLPCASLCHWADFLPGP